MKCPFCDCGLVEIRREVWGHGEIPKVEEVEHRARGPENVRACVKAHVMHGWALDSVDDTPAVGICEACSMPILEGEDYASFVDGVYLCKGCAELEKRA